MKTKRLPKIECAGDYIDNPPPYRPPTTRPLARLNKKTWEIIVAPYDYPIDLARANTPGKLIGWLAQLAEKDWGLLALPDVWQVIDAACWRRFGDGIQGVYRDGKRVDWRHGRIEP